VALLNVKIDKKRENICVFIRFKCQIIITLYLILYKSIGLTLIDSLYLTYVLDK
jgi:hypothetical protein